MSQELTRSSPHFKAYLAAALPLNCLGADSIKPAAGAHAGTPCREIRAVGAGTITMKRASDNASQTLTFADGEIRALQCSEITSVSGPTAVEVSW